MSTNRRTSHRRKPGTSPVQPLLLATHAPSLARYGWPTSSNSAGHLLHVALLGTIALAAALRGTPQDLGAPSRKLSHTHTHTKLKHTHQTRPLILYCFATRPFGQTQSYRTSLAQSNRKNRQGSSRWLHCPLFVDCNKQVPLFRCTTLPHSTDLPRTQELVIEHRTSPRAGSNLQRRTRSDAHKLLRILGLPPRAPHRQHLTPDVLLHRLQLVPGLQADRPGHLGVVAGGHVHHARQRPHTLLDTRLLPLIVPGATRKRRLGAKDGRGGVNRLQRCAEARAGQRGGARGAPSLCRQEADVSDGLVLQGHHSAVVCVCVLGVGEGGGGGERITLYSALLPERQKPHRRTRCMPSEEAGRSAQRSAIALLGNWLMSVWPASSCFLHIFAWLQPHRRHLYVQ